MTKQEIKEVFSRYPSSLRRVSSCPENCSVGELRDLLFVLGCMVCAFSDGHNHLLCEYFKDQFIRVEKLIGDKKERGYHR